MAGGAKESVDASSKSCRVYFETPGCCCDLVASWAGPGWRAPHLSIITTPLRAADWRLYCGGYCSRMAIHDTHFAQGRGTCVLEANLHM